MLPRRTSVATVVALALASAAPAAADRPDTPGTTELFHYDMGDVVETYGSPGGDFLLHFTRSGVNAVPAADTDDSGVPDHVERLAILYDDVLAFYRDELGFRPPLDDGAIADNGGDARFDVYLLDFGGGSDGSFRRDACGVGGAAPGQCVGFMVQENDFAGYGYPSLDYANRVLSSHELFHAVQAAYDADQGSVVSEGTAVWATETFDPTLSDFEAFVGGFLERTDRPIDRGLSGPVDPFSYGAGLFFRFLEERYDRDVIVSLWEACETEPWLPALDALLANDYGSSFAEAFTDLSTWDLYTAGRADPMVAYAEGAMYPPVTTTGITLPHQTDTRLRVFYGSARYYSASPGSRITTRATLVGDTEGLELLLAVRRGSSLEMAAGGTADTAGADEIFVVVVNTATEGESRRPGLCVGDPGEVDDCVASMMGSPDGGVGDAASMTDGGAMTPPEEGCTCAAPGRPGGAPPLAALMLALGLALRRRRR